MSRSARVVVTDHGFADLAIERRVLEEAGYVVEDAQCHSAEEVRQAVRGAAGVLVQHAPVDAAAIAGLQGCRVIVRYGIGYDNVDLQAASALGIPVCNVPNYCVDEVADHTLAMALCLSRQLTQLHRRVLDGGWEITPPQSMPSFGAMTFGCAGFGRIARAVLKRAKAFGFRVVAWDPYVAKEQFLAEGVECVSREALLGHSDILSLHLPLCAGTQNFVGAENLRLVKEGAIVLNTARGGLIDSQALANALVSGHIRAAGLDVLDMEPLGPDHPLRNAPGVLYSSHNAWYSEASLPLLKQLAAEEVLRGLQGQPVLHRVNAVQ